MKTLTKMQQQLAELEAELKAIQTKAAEYAEKAAKLVKTTTDIAEATDGYFIADAMERAAKFAKMAANVCKI